MEIKQQKLKEELKEEQKELMYRIAVRLDEIQSGKYDQNIRNAVKKQ